MSIPISTLDAQNALWMVGDRGLGVEPTPGRVKVIRGWQRANAVDRVVIAARHRGLIQAYRMAKGHVDALERLRTLVKDRLEVEQAVAA